MITLEEWAHIRYAHLAQGESLRSIAKRLGISRNTVAKAIASAEPIRYERRAGPSSFDAYEASYTEKLCLML